MNKPLLSIGIIFKDEIRCLERCLKSLEPLRNAIPCEVVMADTGATDGSRLIAEKYADILFDFEWINDFAAARNAVMDRCSGKWYFSIDCDEWLGGDVDELVEFVEKNHEFKYGGITVRNYQTADLDKGGDYSDFYACRLILMSTGLRYVGAIHERWPTEVDGTPRLLVLQRALLHHDGYVHIDPEAAKKKAERNMTLLHKRLEEDPENIVTLMQCIESSDGTPECIGYVKKGVQAVEEKWQGWQLFGAPIMRYAAVASFRGKLPEFEKYIDVAQELFPNSIYTRIDVEFSAFAWSWSRKEYKKCIQSGERYLKALDDYAAGRYDRIDSLSSTVLFHASQWKNQLLVFMAASYLYEKQIAKACEILDGLNGSEMNVKHVGDCIRVYVHLHSHTSEDTAPMIVRLWEQISQPNPSEERAEERKNEFIRMASEVFLPIYQEDESSHEDFCRHAYRLFLPLEGNCVLGDAAAILDTEDAAALEGKLGRVENLERLPIHVLYHALEQGTAFPPAEKPLNLEQMDQLAGRLAQDKERLFALVRREAEELAAANVQRVTWIRGIALAAAHAFDWTKGEDGGSVARAYASVEKVFLPMCYTAGVLCEENLGVLPPMHRFGWYLPQAFQALDDGDAVGYARLLRKGLSVCESVKPMVEFLLEHTPELQLVPEPSEELRAIADQIRSILSAYAPDDPAVAALKQSEAYQKVAYLIEGAEPPVVGGLLQ